MGPRSVFTALILAFGVAVVFATLTTLNQVGMHKSVEMRSTPHG